MINLDTAMNLHGLTVYRDYNQKQKFIYAPNSPRLAIEGGQPMFQLLVYRDARGDSVQGGGFLAMTVDLGVSKNLLDQVCSELSGRYGVTAEMAPLQVKSGTVRVTTLDSGSLGADAATRSTRFVESPIAEGKPSLYGEQRAVFNAELSQKGAVLMQAALRGGGASPVAVVYDLQFVGLMPAYDVKITIDFQQSYEHLRTRTQMNTLWFRSDIDQELETLRKSGAIRIEETVYETQSSEDAAARMTRLNALAKELAQWSFFRPALNPGAVLAADRGTLAAYDATGEMARVAAGLNDTSRAALTGVGANADAGAPRRPGAALATGTVEQAASTPPATPSAPAATPGPESAVDAWNRAGRPQGAFMLRSLSQDERQRIEYELHQASAVERSIAPQGQIRLLEGAAGLPGRIVQVDLDAEFFKTIEGEVSTAADLAALGIASMTVKLRYGVKPDGQRWKDMDEAVLRAAGDRRPYRFFVDHAGTRELEYQVVLTNKPDSAIGHDAAMEESPWIPTTTRQLDINPLAFSSVMRVAIEAAMVDWEQVRQVQAHVRYRDARSGIDVADTKILTREQASALVPIRPKDPRVREVTVDAQFFYADGSSETLQLAHDGGEPFVVNQPRDATTLVDVTLADVMERYQRISVQLGRAEGSAASATVQRTVTVSPGQPGQQWSFRRGSATDTRFSYRVTSFLKSGAIHEGDWAATDNPLLIVGDRAAGVLTVRAMLLGSLADGGFRLAKLDLDYPDAPDWADRHAEFLLQPNAGEVVWRVPMTRADATSYTYAITWFRSGSGERVTRPPQTTRDEILLLDSLSP